MKAVAVESWLRSLKLAPATKAKLRNQLSALFSHAIRHELYDRLNPITSVRQSAKRQNTPDLLTLAQCGRILANLGDRMTKTAVLVAIITTCRKSEIRGLRWRDVEFDPTVLKLKQGKVGRDQTKLKSEASRRSLPIVQELADVLYEWRSECLYRADDDWVFASVRTGGKEPVWFDNLLKRKLRPAAKAAGIDGKIGWHTYRRSVSSALSDAGETPKVITDLLRHANLACFDLYAHTSQASKLAAQSRLKEVFAAA